MTPQQLNQLAAKVIDSADFTANQWRTVLRLTGGARPKYGPVALTPEETQKARRVLPILSGDQAKEAA